MGAGLLTAARRARLVRVAGILVVLIGVQLCLRGLANLGVVPSAHMGGLMLW
jgi:small neutral amino acid transporter SnatA (MarC family)